MSESVTSLFDDAVKRFNKRPAMQYFCSKSKKWVQKTWADVDISVAQIANALVKAKLAAKNRVAILSLTRPEWVLCDIAIMKALGIVVPIYHSSLKDQIAYILADASANIIFVENEEQLNKIRAIEDLGQSLDLIIIFDTISGALRRNEIYLKDFMADESSAFKSPRLEKNSIATLVYTSGTTGEPKGSMISHDNLLYEAQAIDKLGLVSCEDVQLIFLPLAHIFARVLEFSWIRTGHLLAFAESIDKIVDNMAVVKPTLLAGVPRIFEKVRARAMEGALDRSGLKSALARLAFSEAEKWQPGKEKSFSLKLWQKIVFARIGQTLNERFGGRLRFFVSGGAALAPEVLNFFQLCGIRICEGYGLTETTAATCINLPDDIRPGSVGRPLPGTELKLSGDNEILVRGRGVFLGFWNKPDESRAVLGSDGWFHTGDIGEIDADGFVHIVDRKKDIIVTSQGKNIAPQRVENLLKSKSSAIAHVVVIGEKRPYLTALIALDLANAKAIAFPKGNATAADIRDLAVNQAVFDEVKNAVSLANAVLANFEQIKRFHILDREFEVGKELTPSLKVKRKDVTKEFQREIKIMYA